MKMAGALAFESGGRTRGPILQTGPKMAPFDLGPAETCAYRGGARSQCIPRHEATHSSLHLIIFGIRKPHTACTVYMSIVGPIFIKQPTKAEAVQKHITKGKM